jgi:hypothetical protein
MYALSSSFPAKQFHPASVTGFVISAHAWIKPYFLFPFGGSHKDQVCMDHCEVNGLCRKEFFYQDVIELIPASAKLTEVQLKKQGSQGIFPGVHRIKQHQVTFRL